MGNNNAKIDPRGTKARGVSGSRRVEGFQLVENRVDFERNSWTDAKGQPAKWPDYINGKAGILENFLFVGQIFFLTNSAMLSSQSKDVLRDLYLAYQKRTPHRTLTKIEFQIFGNADSRKAKDTLNSILAAKRAQVVIDTLKHLFNSRDEKEPITTTFNLTSMGGEGSRSSGQNVRTSDIHLSKFRSVSIYARIHSQPIKFFKRIAMVKYVEEVEKEPRSGGPGSRLEGILELGKMGIEESLNLMKSDPKGDPKEKRFVQVASDHSLTRITVDDTWDFRIMYKPPTSGSDSYRRTWIYNFYYGKAKNKFVEIEWTDKPIPHDPRQRILPTTKTFQIERTKLKLKNGIPKHPAISGKNARERAVFK